MIGELGGQPVQFSSQRWRRWLVQRQEGGEESVMWLFLESETGVMVVWL